MLRVSVAALVCVAFSATSFAGGPFGIIRVGKWEGAACTTDKGAFSHCTAAAIFDNGLTLVLAQNANRTWIIGVRDRPWTMRERDSLSLTLTFDNQTKFDISARVGPHQVVGGILSTPTVLCANRIYSSPPANKQTPQFDLTLPARRGHTRC